MSKVYKVVVIGLGKRGMHHATHFQANTRFEVAGICDIDRTRVEAASARFPGAKTATEAHTLAAVRPDVFCFCTLPNVRTELVQDRH